MPRETREFTTSAREREEGMTSGERGLTEKENEFSPSHVPVGSSRERSARVRNENLSRFSIRRVPSISFRFYSTSPPDFSSSGNLKRDRRAGEYKKGRNSVKITFENFNRANNRANRHVNKRCGASGRECALVNRQRLP